MLSQPFEERTQTLSLNTYGCKYPSKHHLPKNTWITLEVPGHGEFVSSHRVRARVVWIQKPRSIREPFQVSVELESPANIWSVTQAPHDWQSSIDAASESERDGAPEQRDELFGLDVTRPEEFSRTNGMIADSEESPLSSSGFTAERESDETSSSEAESNSENETEPDPAQLHRQAFAEASALGFGVIVPEAAEQGSLESPLLSEIRAHLEAHIESQAARAVKDAAQRASGTWQEAIETAENKRLEQAEASFQKWLRDFEGQRLAASEEIAQRATKEIAGARDEIAAHFTDQMAWVREELRSDLKEEFSSHIDQMRKLVAELERGAESLRAEASSANSASERMTQIHTALEAAQTGADERIRSLNEADNRQPASLEGLSAAWQEQLSGEMNQARADWEELLQSSVDSASQKLVSRFTAGSQMVVEGAEKNLEDRIAHFREPVVSSVAEAQQTFERMRGALESDLQRAQVSLGEIERSAHRMRDMANQVDTATQDAVNQLHRRVESALEAQIHHLQQAAETIAAGLPQRIQPAIDSSVQQFMDRTLAEVDARLTPRIERVPELIRELASHEIEAEESLRLYRERLRQASDASRREAQGQLGSLFGDVRQSLDNIRAEALGHWEEELRVSASNAAQMAGEQLSGAQDTNLHQAQQWIEALTQGSLQTAEGVFEERTRQALERLEHEIHMRQNSFAEEMRNQLESVRAETRSRTEVELEHSAGAAVAYFERRASELSEQALQTFTGAADANIAEKTKRAETVAEDIRKNIEEVARMLLDRYCDQMAAHSEHQLTEARESHTRELSVAMEDARRERDSQQVQWTDSLHRLNEESLRNYENQLHHTNEIWVDAALQKLNAKGEQDLTKLSHVGEQTLRNSLVNIFEEMAESLRQKTNEGAPSSGSNRPQAENVSSAAGQGHHVDEPSQASALPPIIAQSAGQGANA